MKKRSLESINEEIKALKKKLGEVKGTETEVYTRIVGYYRVVKAWNPGKREEYDWRIPFDIEKSMEKITE